MAKIFLILLLVTIASAAPDPYMFGAPFYSAAYTVPVAAPANPPGTIATVPTISSAYPFSSVSTYVLGSAYNVPDIPYVSSPTASLVYNAPYTSLLPLSYATEYFTRK